MSHTSSRRFAALLASAMVLLSAAACKKQADSEGANIPASAPRPAATAEKPQQALCAQAEEIIRKYRSMHSKGGAFSTSEQAIFDNIAKLPAEDIARLLDQFELPAESGDPFIADALRWLAAKKPVSLYCDCALKAAANWAIEDSVKTAARNDPAGVKEWLKSAAFPGNDRSFQAPIVIYKLLGALTDSSPSASIALAANGSADVRQVISFIYQQWAFSEPETALRHAHANASDSERSSIESAIVLCAIRNDPSEAFRLANLGDYLVDPKSYARVFEAMLQDYSYEAIDSLSKTSNTRVQGILERPEMIEKISALKPEILVQSLSGVLFTQSNLPLFERAVTALNSSKPEMASELIASLPDGPAKQKLTESIRH